MGQYYKPINLETMENLDAHQFNNGLKLMEHSWIENDFVHAVEVLLMKGNAWYKAPIVWAGDYADEEKDVFRDINEDGELSEVNLYYLSDDDKGVKQLPSSTEIDFKKFKYVVNHTKKEYVNKDSVVKDSYGWKIHPLPLLTCEGNGRGGGDYRGESELIGAWARDSISIEEQCPKGYKKLKFDLVEE